MIDQLAILGSGLMGTGIALNAARFGVRTRIFDPNDEALTRSEAKLTKTLLKWVDAGVLTEDEARRAEVRVTFHSTMRDLSGSDLYIEAVPEDFRIKTTVLRDLVPLLGPKSIVATNTSALSVAALADACGLSSRLVGLHYFSPAERSPVVEFVTLVNTAPDVIADVQVFLKRTHRRILPCKDAPGFAINRFFVPYMNEAASIVEAGLAVPAQVDHIACDELRTKAGPFVVMNLVKPLVVRNAMLSLRPLGSHYQLSSELDRRADLGASWAIAEAAPLSGGPRDQVRERLLASVFLPVLEILDATVATAEDLDEGARLALLWAGGPCGLMRSLGAEAVAEILHSIYPDIDLPDASAIAILLQSSAVSTAAE